MGLSRVGRLTKNNLKNAERDLHVIFKNLGLTIPVKRATLRFGLLQIQYLPIESWLRYLWANQPHLLFGGFSAGDPRTSLLLETFWESFRLENSDHWIFNGDQDLRKTIPFYLHLDEGTGARKSSVLVYNWQPVFGTDTAKAFEEMFSQCTGRSDEEMMSFMRKAQCHNQRGSTYLSRFLFTLLPKRWYTKKFAGVYDKVLSTIAAECCKLASTDFVQGWRAICLGVKGDAPALQKAGHLTRSFQIFGI